MMSKNIITRRSVCKAAVSLALLPALSVSAFAKTVKRFSQSGKQLALKGYDTTAYFDTGKPASGTNATVVKWKGATWRFVSEADAEQFRADPEAYAPQFGGYCTRAMSLGKEVPGDPEVWRIHKGNLHVFFAPKGGKFFDKDPDKMIKLAQAHWKTLTLVE